MWCDAHVACLEDSLRAFGAGLRLLFEIAVFVGLFAFAFVFDMLWIFPVIFGTVIIVAIGAYVLARLGL